MATSGLSNLKYAVMEQEDTATTPPVYETPQDLPGINSVSVTPETETATLWGDNQALKTKTKLKKKTVSLEIAKLAPKDRAKIFGHTYNSDTNTVTVSKNDKPPYLALLFRVDTEDDDKAELHALYKGKFAPAQEDTNTEGENLEFGLHTLEGEFIFRQDSPQKLEDIRTIDVSDTVTETAFFSTVGGGLTNS